MPGKVQAGVLTFTQLKSVVDAERDLAARITILKARQEQLREEIRGQVGTDPIILDVGSHVVKVEEVHTPTFDAEAFRAKHPKLAAQFTKVRTTTRLIIR